MSNQESTILIEWPDVYGIQPASRQSLFFDDLQEKSEIALNSAMSTIRLMADRVSKAIQEIEKDSLPDEIEVEFGIKLDAEVGAILAKAATGAQFTVKFMWKVEQPTNAKTIILPNQ